jgi:hypothetical protein
MALGSAAWMAIKIHGGDPVALQGALSQVYLLFGPVAWSFTDEKGEAIPIAVNDPSFPETLDRLLPFAKGGMEVAEAGDELYSNEVLAPLVERRARLSQDGPTTGLTSVSPIGGSTPRRPSKRSSPTLKAVGTRSVARGR